MKINISPKTLDEFYADNVIEDNWDFQEHNLNLLLYCGEFRLHPNRMNHIERELLWIDVEFGMDTIRQHATCNYLIICTGINSPNIHLRGIIFRLKN